MKLRHERPMSELAFRVTAPLSLHLPDGQSLAIRQWSLAGVTMPSGTEIPPRRGVLSIPFQGIDIRFTVTLEPSVDDPKLLLFVGLSGRERETLAIFYRSILSGRMATTDEVITSLDTPVDLVPMEETESEIAVASPSKAAMTWRLVRNIVLQLALATVVFGYAGSLAWDRFAYVHLQNGRIVAPVVAYVATVPGIVKDAAVTFGDRVTRGQTLVVLESPAHSAAVEATRTEIRLVENQLAAANAELSDMLRASTPDSLADTNVVATTRDVAASDQSSFERAGRISAQRHLIERWRLELGALKRELANRKASKAAINIVANANGMVTAISLHEGQALQAGEVAVIVENDLRRTAIGWLTEHAAQGVYAGQMATVTLHINGERRKLTGIVTNVETAGDPARANTFGANVTIEISSLTDHETRVLLAANTPVRITARKSWARLPWGK